MVDYEPAEHYDRVTRAWALLMGDDLHYGVFDSPTDPLAEASDRLTSLMIEVGGLTEPGPDSSTGAPLRVLDVGCGTGGPASRLVRDHGVDLLGITPSAVGIEAATARFAAAGLPGSFEQRDGTDNGLPDASFDRVWVLEASHLMPDREALISEASRVLRPGGRLVLCDIIRRREIGFRELRERREEFAVLRAGFGAARMDPLDLYAAHAEKHGLKVLTQRDISQETRPTFAAWRANAEQHRDAVLDLIGPDELDVFVQSLEILERLWDDHTLGYGIFAAEKVG